MMRRYILWDFDGTLARRQNQWSGALLETITRLEPTVACELLQLRPHMQADFPWHKPEIGHEHLATPDDWWAEVFPIIERAFIAVGVCPSRAAELAREARSVYLDTTRWEVFDDCVPALTALQQVGWSHAILSNHVPELASLIAALDLRQYFVGVFSSAALGFEKPHPRAFRLTLDALKQPEQVWMIGDNYNADVVGAEQVGIPAILVRSTHPAARYRCETLRQLPQFIGA